MEQISPNPRLSVRRMLRLTVLVAALCYAVASFLLIPLHVRLSSDVMYAETVWAMILYYLVGEETLLYLLVYAVCYPAAIYAVWIAGFKRAARVPVAFALLTLGRFVVDFCMNAIADGALPGADKFLQSELPIIAASYALANLISDEELTEEYILPRAFDPRVCKTVAQAVAECAKENK